MEIQTMSKAQAQTAGKIVAIRSAARPLPFQAILQFNDPTLRGIGGAGYGWPARHGNHRGGGARVFSRARWLLGHSHCGAKKSYYKGEQEAWSYVHSLEVGGECLDTHQSAGIVEQWYGEFPEVNKSPFLGRGLLSGIHSCFCLNF